MPHSMYAMRRGEDGAGSPPPGFPSVPACLLDRSTPQDKVPRGEKGRVFPSLQGKKGVGKRPRVSMRSSLTPPKKIQIAPAGRASQDPASIRCWLPFDHFSRVVAATNKRSGGNLLKTHPPRDLTQFIKLLRGDVPDHREVSFSRLKILAEGQKIDILAAEVRERFEQFVASFTQAEHQSTLGFRFRSNLFDAPEHFQRPGVIAFWSANTAVEARDCFHIMVEDLRARGEDDFECFLALDKIGGEDFDHSAGPCTNSQNALSKVLGPSIGQVIPSDARDHNMFEPEPKSRFSNALRFVGFWQSRRPATADSAKPTWPSTHISQDHEGRCQLAVAFHPIRAFGILADCFQTKLVEQFSRQVIGIALRNRPLQPLRKPPAAAGSSPGGNFRGSNNRKAKGHEEQLQHSGTRDP